MSGLVPDAPDLVKLVIDEGPTPALQMARMSYEEAQAVASAASSNGLRSLAHISSEQDATDAIDAGAVGLAHLPSESLISDALVGKMAERDTWVMTTLAVTEAPRHYLDDAGYLDDPLVVGPVPPAVIATLKSPTTAGLLQSPSGSAYVNGTYAAYERGSQNLVRLRDAGVPLLPGPMPATS